jgi:malonyl CoA-acyl carrier protein transacylase
MKAYLFPGQGSQRVGMGDGLFEAFPQLTSSADSILGYSIQELCLRDPDRLLSHTQYTQPALYVVNALTFRRQIEKTNELPDFVAGHSLGEYNALESAGVLSIEDGLKLVKRRGELMSHAPKGAMAAVIGVSAEKVREILLDHQLSAIDIANLNTNTQTIISGLEADIQHAQAFIEQNDAMFVPLNVSGAFHSRYMESARQDFHQSLLQCNFSVPKIPVIANLTARPYDQDHAITLLCDQLTHTVLWLDSMQFLLEKGVTEFVELGPGDVLTKMVRSIKSQFKPQPAKTMIEPKVIESLAIEPIGFKSSKTPQQNITEWNASHRIGTQVKVVGYDTLLTTKTQAMLLFGHRAAIYMQGYNGYFALDEITAVSQAG